MELPTYPNVSRLLAERLEAIVRSYDRAAVERSMQGRRDPAFRDRRMQLDRIVARDRHPDDIRIRALAREIEREVVTWSDDRSLGAQVAIDLQLLMQAHVRGLGDPWLDRSWSAYGSGGIPPYAPPKRPSRARPAPEPTVIRARTAKDLIWPFDKIGEKGWEPRTRALLASIAAASGTRLPRRCTERELAAAQKRLDTELPPGLSRFLGTFGVADVGEELLAPKEMKRLAKLWAPRQAPRFTDDETRVLPHLVTFSDVLGSGNLMCFHARTRAVWFFDHDTRPHLVRLFDRVDDYLAASIVIAQAASAEDPDAVTRIAERVVARRFGAAVVRKWHY